MDIWFNVKPAKNPGRKYNGLTAGSGNHMEGHKTHILKSLMESSLQNITSQKIISTRVMGSFFPTTTEHTFSSKPSE